MVCEGYQKLCERSQELYLIHSVAGVLSWDLETYLPPKGVIYRADQLAYLETKAHQLLTDPFVGDWLKEAEDYHFEANSDEEANVREWRRAYDRATKLPAKLVEDFERTRTVAREAWAQARNNNDFNRFAPHLQKIVELTREKAQLWGFEESPYDALLDDYEPGAKTSELKPLFEELQRSLVQILNEIDPGELPTDILNGLYPITGQQEFGRQIAEAFGYDFDAGRLDTTTHPFATSLGPNDQRITTRYNEGRFETALYGVMHETGHALYEQGLRKTVIGLPIGDPVSMGIHESQSRLWENHVGRTRHFWEYWYDEACKKLPDLRRYSPEDLVRGVQRVSPGFIRVEADEVGYDLHILLRFELEVGLVEGSFKVSELPELWRTRTKELFDLDVRDDRQGVLQDIHWSIGGIGYFPTYTLGNLNAAQLMATAERQIPTLAEELRRGYYRSLLEWLRRNIHQHGKRYLPNNLMLRATGEPTQAKYRIDYLRKKYLG